MEVQWSASLTIVISLFQLILGVAWGAILQRQAGHEKRTDERLKMLEAAHNEAERWRGSITEQVADVDEMAKKILDRMEKGRP